MVYPMLLLAYLGQGARIIEDGPNVIPNIFYNTIPGPRGGALYWCASVCLAGTQPDLINPSQDRFRCCNPRK